MNVSWKRAFFVGGFLAGLCAVLGLAIAGGDMLTKETIARNKREKEQSALKTVFGENVILSDPIEVKDAEFPMLAKYWTVTLPEEADQGPLGRIYNASGKNGYGDVTLLIGVYSDFHLGNVAVLENTESYGQTLQEEYLDKYAAAQDKEKAAEEVKCGATYGATLCRDMMKQAKAHYQKEGNHE